MGAYVKRIQVVAPLLLAVSLASCAIPLNLTVTDRIDGQMGMATLDVRYHSGPMTIPLRGELYLGTFSSVRPPIDDERDPAVLGLAWAKLWSPSGKSLDCGLRYSIRGRRISPNISGVGQCRDESGRRYDVLAEP